MKRFSPAAVLFALTSPLTILTALAPASAQTPPLGAPPPEAKALVEGPKGPGEAPKIESKTDHTTITLSSGGQGSTGNSRLLAITANGAFETRFGNNGIGASLLANYGRSAPPGEAVQTTTENVQGRVRFDHYIIERASFFLIKTGRHDRFQGIDMRLNIDPGFKYLFIVEQANALWAEAGYDFQYDIRRDDALNDPMMARPPLEKLATDHSSRVFLGLRHAFNEQVTFSSGVEYLQSFVDSSRSRVNFDALFAAKVGAGLAVGFGFTARYDHAPLPGKEQLDTATNVSLIYAYSHKPEAPPPPPPSAPPPPAPPANPPPSTAPPSDANAPPSGASPASPGPSTAPPSGTTPSAAPTAPVDTPPP